MTWKRRPVGDVFRVVNGGTPKTGMSQYWDGTHQWITPAEMGGRDSPHISISRRTLTDEGLRVGAELVPPDSIILSSRAPIGHLVINDVPMAFNQGCKGLVPSAGIDAKFAYYFFLHSKPLLESLGTGTTFKELSGGKLKEVEFPFPDAIEQRRIVAILDEAFAGIAVAKAIANKNLCGAREVLERARRESFSAPRDADFASLGQEVELLVGFAFKSAGYVEAGNSIPLLRGDNIMQGTLRWDDAKHWPLDDVSAYGRFWLHEGDVVLAMDRPWVKAGLKRAILRDEDVPALLVQRTACLRTGPRLDNRYLFQLVSSPAFSKHLLGVQTGIGVPHISGQQIKDFVFHLPPIAEQRRTVEILEALQGQTLQLESIYIHKLRKLDELKKAMLQRAFTNQL